MSAASMEREMRVFSGQENANDVAWSYNAYKAGERELVDEVVRQRKMSVILQGLVRKREAFFRRSCASSPTRESPTLHRARPRLCHTSALTQPSQPQTHPKPHPYTHPSFRAFNPHPPRTPPLSFYSAPA